MDLASIFPVLSRRRLWVGGALLLAVVVGLLVAFRVTLNPPGLHSRQYQVGQASLHVLVDTPRSQVADLDPPGADALSQRANLFANLIATPPVQARIAALSKIAPQQLETVAPSTTSALVPTPLASTAASDGSTGAPYHLVVRTDDTLPILSIAAQAPTAEGAALLANSTFTALREHLNRIATVQHIPASRKPVVSALGVAAAGEVAQGPSPLIALGAVLVVFLLACAAIVIGDGLLRRLRTGAATPPPEGPEPAFTKVPHDPTTPRNGVPRDVAAHRGG